MLTLTHTNTRESPPVTCTQEHRPSVLDNEEVLPVNYGSTLTVYEGIELLLHCAWKLRCGYFTLCLVTDMWLLYTVPGN